MSFIWTVLTSIIYLNGTELLAQNYIVSIDMHNKNANDERALLPAWCENWKGLPGKHTEGDKKEISKKTYRFMYLHLFTNRSATLREKDTRVLPVLPRKQHYYPSYQAQCLVLRAVVVASLAVLFFSFLFHMVTEGWLEIDKHYSLGLCFSIEKQPETVW